MADSDAAPDLVTPPRTTLQEMKADAHAFASRVASAALRAAHSEHSSPEALQQTEEDQRKPSARR